MSASADLNRLAVDIGVASKAAVPAVRAALKKGAQNIKYEARSNVSSHPSWKRIGSTINYSESSLGGSWGLSVEVGYDDRGQGELAGIYEFGSARRGPHPTLMPAFETESPRLVEHVGKAVDVALRAGRL